MGGSEDRGALRQFEGRAVVTPFGQSIDPSAPMRYNSRVRLLLIALSAPLLLLAQDSNSIPNLAIGHQLRQDDSPVLANAPDGSVWSAWLSFEGSRDDVAIRQLKDGKWGALQWVPNTSGDSWLPQVGVDSQNRVWVVWTQMAAGNWDLYARRFDPAKQEWSALTRLSSAPQPDINPRLASDGQGRVAVVWQGFRNGRSGIFLRALDGDNWTAELKVSTGGGNDWEPAAAFDRSGGVWIAYDSYRNGSYDIFLTHVGGGKLDREETQVAVSPKFEARATVAVDSSDRVWVAWEEGPAAWGKDQGYILRPSPPGVPLGGLRRPRVRVLDNGRWGAVDMNLAGAFAQGNTYQPHVFADSKGGIWIAAKSRINSNTQVQGARGYFEYAATRFDGTTWSQARPLPTARGRSSTRISAASMPDGAMLMAWSTDNRPENFGHRPIRQQVYAGTLTASMFSGAGRTATGEPEDTTRLAHPNEAADLKAIRSYSAKVDGKEMNIVRGDFHRHTELSWDGGGTQDGNLQDFYRYMIDVAAMDFGASTDHQGGAWPYWWWYTQKMTDMYNVPGAYTPIFGYERSAIYPNGHRNVFFAKRSDSRVTPFNVKAGAAQFQLPPAPIGDEPGVGTGELVENDTKLLYEDIRPRNGIAIPHTSATRMGTDWRDNDPDLEPVVEIFQGARTNYESLDAPHAADPAKDAQHIQQAGYQPAGMVSNAWAKGYKLGIITSSDHGSTHISYAMVYTADRSRQGILDAIRKRHTYGAMDNIILDVRMGSHFMGDEFDARKAEPIRIKASGTVTIARVQVIKDNKVIYTAEPKTKDVSLSFTDTGDVTGRHFYYVRVQQENELLAWSSPFFINYGK